MRFPGILSSALVMLLLLSASAAHAQDITVAQLQTTPEEDQAIEEANNNLIEISTPSGDIEEDEEVSYFLPYPGLLPDHPLYFLKSFRDQIIGMLITDPVKKAEFALLNADKQVNSALALSEKEDRQDLVVDSLQNARQHLQLMTEEIKNARRQKKDYRTVLDRSRTAVLKHSEVVENMTPHLTDTGVQAAQQYQNFLSQISADLLEIK